MSISEQVKELREFEIGWLHDVPMAKAIMRQAADTIESLSAKLADMERSAEDCGGGWIPCKERLPEENEFVLVVVQLSEMSFKEYETCCGYLMNNKWYTYTERDFFEVGEMHRSDKVIAWQLLPKPYHEP